MTPRQEGRAPKAQPQHHARHHRGRAGGLTTDEINDKMRELGIGVKRRATLNDIRRDLHKQKAIYEFNGKWFVTSK